MKLSVVIPFYNEEKNIPLVLQEFAELERSHEFELICVDDGSRDATKQVFAELERSRRYPFVRYISYSPNGGYGHAIMTGVRAAEGDIIAWTHADLQTDPADVFRALTEYEKGAGKRIVKGRRIKRRFADAFLTGGMSILASIVLGMRLREINAQPKLFDRAFLALLTSPPKDFSLDLYLLAVAKKNGYAILDIPVEFKKRLHGVSKSAPNFRGRLKTIWRTVKYIFRMSVK